MMNTIIRSSRVNSKLLQCVPQLPSLSISKSQLDLSESLYSSRYYTGEGVLCRKGSLVAAVMSVALPTWWQRFLQDAEDDPSLLLMRITDPQFIDELELENKTARYLGALQCMEICGNTWSHCDDVAYNISNSSRYWGETPNDWSKYVKWPSCNGSYLENHPTFSLKG